MELRDVKPVMAQGLTVIWQNMPYTVSGCTIKYDRKNNRFYYLLELLDMTAYHSVMVVPIEDVAIAEKSTETAQI